MKLALGILLVGEFAAASIGQSSPPGRCVIEPFDYHGVSLHGGIFQTQLDQVCEFYLQIPDEDLLKGFRTRAGRPAPGNDLGGWYSDDVFHVFGQIVSGLSRLYAATGNEAFRAKANHLVSEWAQCIAPDGYFFASMKPFARHYVFDKTLWGLLDNYRYCGNRDATNHLRRITGWAITNLEQSRRPNDTATEWYTLSENLYRAYHLTGDDQYRRFAEVWEYPAYWDFYARRADIFGARADGSSNDVYHAYSHVNTLGGAAAAYLVKGDARYLALLTNAFDYLQSQQVFATGGYGPDEQLLPRARRRARLGETQNTFEVQCGSWAGFKLGKYLLSFTGDARFGDWIERLALNSLGASIPMTPDGRVFYYADHHLHGGQKRNVDIRWSCCTGTRPQAVADLHDLIYFHDSRDLYVNLYAPSTLRWPRAGGAVTVSQSTAFPESDRVEFQLACPKPARFAIKFRAPAWLAAPMEARVNGRRATLRHGDHHWAALERPWNNGDRIELRLPMKLWAAPLDATAPLPAAALYGPTVLAFQSPAAHKVRQVDPARLAQHLKAAGNAPLRFVLSADPAVTARPFYSLPAGEEYFVYLDPAIGSRVPHPRLRYTGRWSVAGPHHITTEPGATVEHEFTGTGIRWLGFRYDDAGRSEVSLDGKVVEIVDQYGAGRALPFDWSRRALPPGPHTIRIKLLEEKNPASHDRFLNIAGFETLGETD